MKRFLLSVPVVMVAMLYAESHASAQRLRWVQTQNARDNEYGIRFAAEGDTLVIFDPSVNRGAFDVETVAMEPRFSRPILRAGFRKVRAGNFEETIR
jgi:hypothetical protein